MESVQLFSPACSTDARALGLNDLLTDGKVSAVQIFCASVDVPLKLAELFGKPFGYGSLGLRGLENLDPNLSDRVVERYRPTFGHSSWFDQDQEAVDNFQWSMRQVIEFVNKTKNLKQKGHNNG